MDPTIVRTTCWSHGIAGIVCDFKSSVDKTHYAHTAKRHGRALFIAKSYPCRFGCFMGHVDEYTRTIHYCRGCFDARQVTNNHPAEVKCGYPDCEKQLSTVTQLRFHHSRLHERQLYEDPATELECHPCQRGILNEYHHYAVHLASGQKKHHDAMREYRRFTAAAYAAPISVQTVVTGQPVVWPSEFSLAKSVLVVARWSGNIKDATVATDVEDSGRHIVDCLLGPETAMQFIKGVSVRSRDVPLTSEELSFRHGEGGIGLSSKESKFSHAIEENLVTQRARDGQATMLLFGVDAFGAHWRRVQSFYNRMDNITVIVRVRLSKDTDQQSKLGPVFPIELGGRYRIGFFNSKEFCGELSPRMVLFQSEMVRLQERKDAFSGQQHTAGRNTTRQHR